MVTSAARHATLADMDWGAGATGRLAGVSEIADILGVSRARADQLSRQQGFPKHYDVLAIRLFRNPALIPEDEVPTEPRPQRIWLVRDIRAWHRQNPKIGKNDPQEEK